MPVVYCDTAFPDSAASALRAGLAGHRLLTPAALTRSNLGASAADAGLQEAEIAFGQPPVEGVLAAPHLRWVHLTSAGWTRFDLPEVHAALRDRNLALTTSSTVYADPCAEHVLALMLAGARQLPAAFGDQHGARSWPAADLRARSSLLRGQTVLLLGFGAIGRRLAELLAPFRARLLVYRRSPTGDEPGERVTDLDDALARADHVVNLLPENPSTRGFLDAGRLARMVAGAHLYNVGRGSTIDEGALIAELERGRFAGAWLDVAGTEPLPPGSPLWHAPRCFITPHTAGGRREEHEALVVHFLENFTRYLTGEALRDRVV